LLIAMSGLLLLTGAGAVGAPHVRAWYHYQSGQRALERRAFAEARDHAAVCLVVWPHSPKAHLLAARAARRAGLLDEARQYLDGCPSSPDILEDRQLERFLLQAQRDGLAEVEQLLLEQVQLDHPQSPAILETLTWEWMRRHQLGQARDALEMWRQRQPGEAEVPVRLGWIAERLFHQTEAVDHYRQALALDPSRTAVRQRLGEMLVNLSRGEEAAEQFEFLLRERPDDTAVLLGLARARFKQARLDAAEKLLDDVLTRRPDLAAALGERGRLALVRGQTERAEEWLRRAVAAAPHEGEIIYSLVQCLEKRDKRAEAEEYAARLRRIDEDQGRMRGLMERVLRAPTSAPLRCEIGVIFLRNDFREDGLRWLHTALEQDPNYRPAHKALAESYQQAGQLDLAARHRQAAQTGAKGPLALPAAPP
jgi:Tfp pilus assembly protein PilF